MSNRPRVFISTVPFCEFDPRPRTWLEEAGVEIVENPLGRRLKEDEAAKLLQDIDMVVAGTEPLTDRVMASAPRLRLIARVGIGLDSVDLLAARRRGIAVSYTPDGPSPAVSELTIGLMIDLLRHVHQGDRAIRAGRWGRFMGRRLGEVTVGLIGVGRIGKLVTRHLRGGFPGVRILAHDIAPDEAFGREQGLEWRDLAALLAEADVVSVHVPLTGATRGMIAARELALIGPAGLLINTARGGIVDEAELAEALRTGTIAGAAVDAFVEEPYAGPLADSERCILTCHMGSMSQDCRSRMEIEATQEVLRALRGEPLASPVPDSEYVIAEGRG